MSIVPSMTELTSDMFPKPDSTVSTGHNNSEIDIPTNKQGMFQTFQSWALRNYGDSGKTKTVTRRKYQRIVKILKGEEQSTAENSKFRFWVKAKGFRVTDETSELCGSGGHLCVPTRGTGECGTDNDTGFKKVAVVEDFFDIIYNVHVEMDGRGGKHAGQKRTYRAIAETYAFLPREAVTRFLMSCAHCQKRMHITTEPMNNNNKSETPTTDEQPVIDFSVPITQTYLNHMRNKDYDDKVHFNDEDSMSSEESEISRERSVSPRVEKASSPANPTKPEGAEEARKSPINMASGPKCARLDEEAAQDSKPAQAAVTTLSPQTTSMSPVKSDDVTTDKLPTERSERKRRASDEVSLDSSTKASDSGNLDELQAVKDDDDDDENDDDDKVLPGQDIDPERLKAFNMFVRLFVDENLDRMVPISKQPKDKIQAILEACDRQFPEFHERARKRIRTYLKSCRRMRRSKEQNGWEPLRPTPPHLTSAAAEGILAQACENESNNAKRMRMGLDPLPATAMQNRGTPSSTATAQQTQSAPAPSTPQSQPPERQAAPPPPPPPPQPAIPKAHTPTQPPAIDRPVAPASDFLRHTQAAFRPPHDFHPPFFANGNGLFRHGFPTGYQPPAHHHPQILQHQPLQHSQVQNGPTDLSLKKQNSKSQLSPSEVATIKQLIAGYRESAAFLYRSADELEQLLLQQN